MAPFSSIFGNVLSHQGSTRTRAVKFRTYLILSLVCYLVHRATYLWFAISFCVCVCYFCWWLSSLLSLPKTTGCNKFDVICQSDSQLSSGAFINRIRRCVLVLIPPQHHWETWAIVCDQKIPGCAEDPQPDSISAVAPQAVAGQRRPHNAAAQLLHQAERQLQAGGVHQGGPSFI